MRWLVCFANIWSFPDLRRRPSRFWLRLWTTRFRCTSSGRFVFRGTSGRFRGSRTIRRGLGCRGLLFLLLTKCRRPIRGSAIRRRFIRSGFFGRRRFLGQLLRFHFLPSLLLGLFLRVGLRFGRRLLRR